MANTSDDFVMLSNMQFAISLNTPFCYGDSAENLLIALLSLQIRMESRSIPLENGHMWLLLLIKHANNMRAYTPGPCTVKQTGWDAFINHHTDKMYLPVFIAWLCVYMYFRTRFNILVFWAVSNQLSYLLFLEVLDKYKLRMNITCIMIWLGNKIRTG